MAASVDGDIRLSVGLDTSSIESQLKGLGNSLGASLSKSADKSSNTLFERIKSAVKRASQGIAVNIDNSALENTNKQIDKTIAKEQELGNEAQKTSQKIIDSNKKAGSGDSPLQLQIDKTIARLNELKAKQEKIGDTFVIPKEYEKLDKEYEKIVTRARELETEMDKLKNRPGGVYGNAAQELSQLEAEYGKLGSRLQEVKASIAELRGQGLGPRMGTESAEYAKTATQVEFLERHLEMLYEKQARVGAGGQTAGAQMSAGHKEAERSAKNSASKISSYFGGAFNKIKNLGSKMVNGIKGFFNKIKDRSKDSASSMDKFFKHGFRNILKYALGIRSFYFLFRKIRSAAKEALTAMAVQFPEVNAQLSELKNSFIQLKGSVGTLVQPLLQALAPALTTIINLFSEALSVVGSFFALLTGQKFIYKAKKGVSSFAAAQDESTGATKKNTDALEDNQKQLGNYDKLNIIDQQRDKAGAGGGGGGAGGGAGEMMFEKVPIDSQVKDFMDRFKDAWKKGDLTEIGTIIGTKLKNALNKIPWHSIQAKAEQVGKNLGTLIAGFIKTPGLAKSIGNAIGQALNTLLMGLRKFVKHVPWYEFGEFLADMLSSAFTAKDKNGTTLIGNVAKTIVAILNAAIDTIKGFADKMQDKWSKIGDEISKWIQWAIKNIKVGDFMEACAKLINGIVTVIYKIVSNKDTWKSLGSKVAEGINKFFHTMNWGNFAKTISDGLLGLGTAIITALDEIDWDAVGEAVADFLGNINWIELLVTVGKIIVKALGGAIKAAISALKKDPWGIASAFVTVFGGLFVFKKLKGLVPILKNSFSKIFSLSVEQSLEGKEVEAAAKSATKTGIIGNIKGAFGKLKGTLTKDLGKGMSGVLNGLKNHAGLIAAAAGIGLAIGGWIADKINAEMDKWYDETAKRAKDAAATVKTILGKAQSEGATKDQQAELLRKQYEAVQKVIDNNQKAMEKIEDIYVIPGMEATDINYMNAQRTVTEGQSARKEIQDQYKELTGSLEGLTGASDNAYKSLGKVDSMITSPPKGVDPAKWLTASSKMENALNKLEIPDSKKNAILKKLRDMVDQGKISFEQYEKIAGGSYQTTKDLYDEIGKVAGKKVKAEVKAEVKGKNDVTTLEKKLKEMSGKQYTTKQILKIQAQFQDKAVQYAYRSGHFSVSDYLSYLTHRKATGGIFTGSGWHNIEGYAKGGMPKSGQFFMARENGIPELVGTIKNHTAVMNNGQIVASVANGVYQAVASVAKVILPYVRSQTHAMNWLAQNGLQLPDITIGNILPSNSNFLNALQGTNTTTNNITNGVDYEMLVQAFKEAQTNQPIVVQMPNGKVLAEVVWDEEQKKYKQARSSTLQVNYA